MRYPPLDQIVRYENALGEVVTGRVIGVERIVDGSPVTVVTIRTHGGYTVRMLPAHLAWEEPARPSLSLSQVDDLEALVADSLARNTPGRKAVAKVLEAMRLELLKAPTT